VKVLFVTDVGDGSGIGGHIYSFQALIRSLLPHIQCVAVTFGSARCPALEPVDCRQYQIPFGIHRLRVRELSRFMDIVRTEKPDVIHAFDPKTGAFARWSALRVGCGLLETKCGGPNPQGRFPHSYFPCVPQLVVYSEENERYFRCQRAYRRMQIRNIPNRIHEFLPDAGKIAALRARVDPRHPVILRVGRISRSYQRTAEKSIRLVRRLVSDGIPAQLVFLGVVHEKAAEQDLRVALKGCGTVVSDPELVKQASSVLDAGDLVVGTGRGLMEAAARGRILLVPARTGQLPTLVDETNWESLFSANFSERSEVAPWDEEANYRAIQQVLRDPEYRQRLSAFSLRLFKDRFSLETVLDQYLALYEEARLRGCCLTTDMAKHWLWMLVRTRRRPYASDESHVKK